MTDEQDRRPLPPPDGPGRRIGPYEQSLRDQSQQIARAVARRAARRRRNRILAGVAALVLLTGGAYGAVQFLGGSPQTPLAASTSAVPEHCDDPNTVTLAVPAVLGPALTEVATALADRSDGPCTTFDLETSEAGVVSRLLETAARPDGWITDSGLWLDHAAATGAQFRLAEPFATSAIVVAMSPERAQSLEGQPSWADLVAGSDPVRFADPSRSTVSLLSLAAVGAATSPEALTAAVTAAAKAPAPTVEPASLARTEQVPAVPVAEAALLEFNRSSPSDALAAVAPAEGTAPLEYSLVSLTEDAAADSSIEAFTGFLRSDEAQAILVEHGFRVPGAAPPTAQPLVGSITLAEQPPATLSGQVRTLWNDATPQRQVLLALDVSGSMLTRTEEGTRLALAQDAVRISLASLPEASRAALWVFSNHIGVQGDDFKPLTNYGTLADPRHRGALEKGVASMEQTVGGGSGLYDSVFTAYVAAKKSFLAGQTNLLVVVVDGPNEDDYGLSLRQLTAKLAAEKDPTRPVQVLVVGVGDAPDEAAIKQILSVTGGRYVPAPEPDDLRLALVGAVTGS